MRRQSEKTEFLKECMADALLILMQRKPVNKINVDEITKTAGVGRATWFRNFHSKQEAITYKLAMLWERYSSENNVKLWNQYNPENARDFFEFNYSIRELLSLIYKQNMQNAVYAAFYTVLSPHYGGNVEGHYMSRFFSYGLFGLLDKWIKRGYCETPEYLTKLFLEKIANR